MFCACINFQSYHIKLIFIELLCDFTSSWCFFLSFFSILPVYTKQNLFAYWESQDITKKNQIHYMKSHCIEIHFALILMRIIFMLFAFEYFGSTQLTEHFPADEKKVKRLKICYRPNQIQLIEKRKKNWNWRIFR